MPSFRGASRALADSRLPAPAQGAAEIAATIERFLIAHAEASVLEDGKALFELASTKWTVSAEHNRCTLHLWSEERNLVRRVLGTRDRDGVLRLSTERLGRSQPKLLELCAGSLQRTPSVREAARARYLKLLERVLEREFAPWKAEGFRTAMDLERSFGPAYARGSLVRGREAWAVIGAGAHESPHTIDGILTLGILWLNDCRERAGGRRLYTGLRIVVPQGQGALTQARLAWMNTETAQWQIFELNEREERLVAKDAGDHGNLRTRLVHRPDESGARERFAEAAESVRELVPAEEWKRVEQHLRSSAELVFLLHGLQLARARVVLHERSFGHRVEVSVGAGAAECLLTEASRELAREHIGELCRRRRAPTEETDFGRRGLREGSTGVQRRIGSGVLGAAHRRTLLGQRRGPEALLPVQDPLFRAVPERWLESVLRADLAPLTRQLAPLPAGTEPGDERRSGRDAAYDPDTFGNRADPTNDCLTAAETHANPGERGGSRLIPRLDPRHVYTQVPAIAGASDRGLLDLLGVTEDGRLAVIELKTEDDLHFALQGLDYWIRVRQHHAAALITSPACGSSSATGTSSMWSFQRSRRAFIWLRPPCMYTRRPRPCCVTFRRRWSGICSRLMSAGGRRCVSYGASRVWRRERKKRIQSRCTGDRTNLVQRPTMECDVSLSLDAKTTALVLIDLEQGIVAMPVKPHSGPEVVERSARLAEAMRAAGGTVVYVHVLLNEILSLAVDKSMSRGTPPPEASELVAESGYQEATDVLVAKRQWDAFYGTNLEQALRRRGVKTIVMAGIATNLGVESTARSAQARGYEVVFASDAMATLSEEMQTFALEQMFPMIGRVRTIREIEVALRG